MPALVWDKVEERGYELGIDHGVLYNEFHTNGVAWNGLVSVEEARDDTEVLPLYYDGIKRLDSVSVSDFGLTISAITMPIEFMSCLGDAPVLEGFYLTRQLRRPFGLVYRTGLSVDGYKLHLVYNATVVPNSKTHSTVSSNIEPSTFSWALSTRPEPLAEYRPTAHLIVDSRKVLPDRLAALEDILFGSSDRGLVDGGPILANREMFTGGVVTENPGAIVIDGGSPTSSPYSTPTLISPAEVQEILEGP